MSEPEINKITNHNIHPVSNDQHENVSALAAMTLLKSLGNTVENNTTSQIISSPSPLATNEIIVDRYQILDVLGQGTMGLVYKAKDLELKRTVAIKVLAPDKPLDDDTQRRFEREGEVIASLNHANIVTLYDSGVLKNDMLYLAMEYIDGQTLADFLKSSPKVDVGTAVPLFTQICTALEYAHGKDIIHRDLKPNNIMIVKDHRGKYTAKVIDFSIAKFTKPMPDQRTITRTGEIFGSPLYMSPEQCQGKKLDCRSDIYSFGCIMYEMLCGVPPLVGNNAMATIYMHVHRWPIPMSEIVNNPPLPVYLEGIIVRCLDKDPNERFQSATGLLEALDCFCEEEKKRAGSSWLKQLSQRFSRPVVEKRR